MYSYEWLFDTQFSPKHTQINNIFFIIGYTVEEEVSIGDGKAVDLVATKDSKRIAIEVETGKSDVDENVRKCREAGFNIVNVLRTKS